MHWKRTLFFVLLIAGAGLYLTKPFASSSIPSRPPEEPHKILIQAIGAQVAKTIEKETGLTFFDSGQGAIKKVSWVMLCFNQYHPTTIEEGRKLLTYCVNTYLAAINANEELRPSLTNYPFQPKDVLITIFCYENNKKKCVMGEIGIMEARNGEITFETRQPSPENLRVVHRESYQEALALLENLSPTN